MALLTLPAQLQLDLHLSCTPNHNRGSTIWWILQLLHHPPVPHTLPTEQDSESCRKWAHAIQSSPKAWTAQFPQAGNAPWLWERGKSRSLDLLHTALNTISTVEHVPRIPSTTVPCSHSLWTKGTFLFESVPLPLYSIWFTQLRTAARQTSPHTATASLALSWKGQPCS